MSYHPLTTKNSDLSSVTFKFPPIKHKKFNNPNTRRGNSKEIHRSPTQSQEKLSQVISPKVGQRLKLSHSNASERGSQGSILKDFYSNVSTSSVRGGAKPPKPLSFSKNSNRSLFLMQRKQKEMKERDWVNTMGQERYKNNAIL